MAKLGNAIMSLLLDKQARENMKQRPPVQNQVKNQAQTQAYTQNQAPNPVPQDQPHPTQEQINARLEEVSQTVEQRRNNPARQQLIEEAMRVRASKMSVLDDLSEEQKLKLQALAMKSFFNQDPDGSQ
ncbi:hypothetical protein ACFL12_07760 [Pseudomonadota bacterium]